MFLEGEMALTVEEVKNIAALAQLELNAEEIASYQEQLSRFLVYAAQLQAVDTTGVPPTASVSEQHSVLRADEPASSAAAVHSLANAPAIEARCYWVPAFREKED